MARCCRFVSGGNYELRRAIRSAPCKQATFASRRKSLAARHYRLRLELLEDRRLLTASHAPVSDIVLDSSVTPTALIVQFRTGQSAVSSLAAYTAGVATTQQWSSVAPGMREVPLRPGVDLNSALAAYKNDANVLFAEPDYHIKVTDFPADPPNDPSLSG